MKPENSGQAWIDALPDATLGIDSQGRLEWANRAASELFGWAIDDYLGRSVLDLIHPEDLHFALLSLDSVQSKDVGTFIELRVQTAFGWRLVEVVGANRVGTPGLDCLVMTLRDLTQRRRWEVGRSDDAIFRAVVHNAASVLMLIDRDRRIEAMSGAVTRQLGHDPEKIEGTSLLDLVAPQDREAVGQALIVSQNVTEGERDHEPVTVEAGLLDGDGRVVPFELTFVDMSGDPTVTGTVVSAHNITKLRAFQRALADLAQKDPLTLLPNRSMVDDRLSSILAQRVAVAVGFVDLDGFKALNDEYGHHFGDEVLRAVADRLSATVRPTDLVARYGGDEFVIIAHDLAEGAHLEQRLAATMAEPIDIDGTSVMVKASVGVAYTRAEDTVTGVLIRADRAMYGSKGARRGLGAAAG